MILKNIYVNWFDCFSYFMIIRPKLFENEIMSKFWLDSRFKHCFKRIFILKCHLHIRIILTYIFTRLMFKLNCCKVHFYLSLILCESLFWIYAGNIVFIDFDKNQSRNEQSKTKQNQRLNFGKFLKKDVNSWWSWRFLIGF